MDHIVLINAPVTKVSPHSKMSLPLGLAYIGAVLIEEGRDVRAIDFNVSGLNLARVETLARRKPKLVGISAHTETYLNAVKIAHRIKEIDPEIAIVVGGPHASILPREALAEPAFDYVSMGEGEATMAELADYVLDGKGHPSDILGLGYRDEEGIAHINKRRPLLNPDDLPLPARDLFPLEFYQEQWNVSSARGGCPFKCPFCSASFIWEGIRRARSPENIIQEIRMLFELRGATYIFFAEDLFTVNKKWLYELMGLIKALPYEVKWGCATRVDMVDRQVILDMADAGCTGIQFGVESGSQRILDAVKGITKDKVREAIAACVEAEIDVASSFMIPFPDDTRETLQDTKEFIKELYDMGSRIYLSYTSPYPGTEFYLEREKLGITILTDKWDEFDAKHNIIETKHLKSAEIEKIVQEIAEYVGLIKRA